MVGGFIEEMPRGYQKEGKSPDVRMMHPATTGMWNKAISNGIGGGKIVLGYDDHGHFCGYDDNRHFITFAGSRSGKGVSLIIPTLLTYDGGILAIDPKGELATITAARRGKGSDYSEGLGHPVYVLDPFQRAERSAIEYRSSFNPLSDLDPETDKGLTYATMIADGLVIQESGNSGHFTASARSFLRGLILYVCTTETGAGRSLIRVRELISQPEADFKAMLTHMTELGGVIGRAASSLLLKSEAERASVISTADVQTDFLEDGAMREVLTGHDFDLKALRSDNAATVYLCLPAGRLATHGRWLRLMIAIAMEEMEELGAISEEEIPALFVLDEFAALGHMASIEKAAGQIAGFGVKLWTVLQDVTQLKRDYKDSWETFIGNAGMVTAFGVSDASTTEYISKLLGKTVIQTFTTSGGHSSNSAISGVSSNSSVGHSISYQSVNLLDPHEVARYFARDSKRLLCLPQGEPSFIVARTYYYEKFVGDFDPRPGEKPPVLPQSESTKLLLNSQVSNIKEVWSHERPYKNKDLPKSPPVKHSIDHYTNDQSTSFDIESTDITIKSTLDHRQDQNWKPTKPKAAKINILKRISGLIFGKKK